MAAALIGGSALGAVFGELLNVVVVTKKNLNFKSELKNLESTLNCISPMFDEIEMLNKVLKCPEGETDKFVDQLREGKDLILKCSRIQCWKVWKRSKYANKLIDLNKSLLRFFQVDVQIQLACDSKKTLVGLSDNRDKLDRVLSILENGGGGFCNSGGFQGLCGVPGLPDLLVGLDSPLRELKEMVCKGEGPVLISAPGGCGKTTLAKMLCHDEEVKGKFGDNIFFVTVSRRANLKGIVRKLFEHKGSSLPEFQSDEDAINQLEQFMRQPATDILLVLDDVWYEWKSLIQKFMFGKRGYKLLVTSRFVFPKFDSMYILDVLNDQDAMTLFRHSALPQDGSSNIPNDLVNKIVKGCNGFPLALIVVGGSLYGRPEVSWRSMLKKWSNGLSIFDSNKEGLLLPLQASLDALDDELKECYQDLGSFPEDQKIPATALMDMWTESYNLDEEGMETHASLVELSLRNLVNLVPSRNDAIQVKGYCNDHFVMQHDLLRDLALHQGNQDSIEQRKRLIMEISGNDLPNWWVEQRQQPVNARLLSISTDETFSSTWYDMQLPKIEVLILNLRTKNYTLPQFMERMDKLKVLIVTNYGFCPAELDNFPLISFLSGLRRIMLEHVSISCLCTSLLQMRNLRKISLIMCEVGKSFEKCSVEIPHMLPNLSEIEIAYCDDLVEFPAGFCNIVSLKTLSITYCNELGALPEGIGRMTNLEVLRLHSCMHLEELPELIGSLHKLSFLDISDCLSMGKMPERMGELCGLRTLNMRGCCGLQELPPSIEDLLELECVICDEEIAYLWKGSRLANLNIEVEKQDINLNWLHKISSDESKFIKKTIEVIEDKRDTSKEDIVAAAAEDWELEEKPIIEWNNTNIELGNCGVDKLPKKPYCPSLEELSLQQNPNLAEIPLTFFESMPTLQVLDLSNTSIKSLPPSISRLVQLREFFMKSCELMMELPPEIGLVGNLKVLDLEGTMLICLPKEIGMLHELTCLKVSLHKRADRYKESRGIEAIVPRGILSKLSRLKELSIDVYPDCGWWDTELESIIINEQSSFRNLHTLKLYFPTVKLLEQLWQLPGVHRISNNRLTVGRHEKLIITPLPSNLQDKFEELPGCLKYVNGEGSHDAIAKALRYARALLLYRHWTIERLSEFKIDQMPELSSCLLVQCNEMKTIVDEGDFYREGDGRKNYRRQPILGYLEYLSIHCMKNLESIWKGPIFSMCLYHLQTLALHTCPKLSTLFNLGLLGNLRSLRLLIVEDCPEMKSLVSLESSFSDSDDYFLPSLRKISLLHLPELVSISSGLRIAPELESLIIYNCPKLKSLSPMELSSKYMEKIKGQSSWWEALDWHNSEWSSDQRDYMVRVFRPLGRDTVLMKQLAKAVGTSLHGQCS